MTLIATHPALAVDEMPREVSLASGRLIAFSTIAMPITAASVPLTVYLPPIYGQHFRLSLAALGIAFLAFRRSGRRRKI